MQQQQPPQQSNIMLTSLDKIPLKPSNNTDDMSDDPVVKDVLNEFEKELSLNEQKSNYNINYNQQQQIPQQQQQQQLPLPQQQIPLPQQQIQYQQQRLGIPQYKNNYIDNVLLTKTFIICIIIALIINPVIYNTIISKIPINLMSIFETYNYIIKLGLIFIIIYLFMFYKLL